MLKADLHTHSFCSDGTSSPEEVAYGAWKAGVKIFALADHDTTEGVLRAKAESEKHGMDWVSAVEISTREHDHLHFLGYNIDINNAGFQAFLKQNRENRVLRIKKIIKQIADSGVENCSFPPGRLPPVSRPGQSGLCPFGRRYGSGSHTGNQKSRRAGRDGAPGPGTGRMELSRMGGSGVGWAGSILSGAQLYA